MIGYDRLISIAREICKGSLRPTYCKDPETFHPHLWVIEAMKQAYDWGHADATSQTTANLQAFVAECSLVQSEDLSKAKAEIINEIGRVATARPATQESSTTISEPNFGMPPTTGHTFNYVEAQREPGDLPPYVDRDGRLVVEFPTTCSSLDAIGQGEAMTSIYIAAASKEIDRAERVRDELRNLGYEITSTWMDQIRQVGAANPRDASAEQRRIWAEKCLREVRNSDLLLFLVPPDGIDTVGAWCELAKAYEDGLLIVCAGETKRSIFCALVDEFATDEEAILHIVNTW